MTVFELRRRLPTDQQLADECGVSVSAIRQTIRYLTKLQTLVATNAENPVRVGVHDRSDPPAPGP